MKINDLNPYPQPVTPPVTPPAGQTLIDPTFGTTVLRVTDEQDSAGVMFANGYSAIYDMFNTDSSRFVYLGLNGSNWSAQLDVKKRTVSNKKTIAKNGAYFWSRVSPNVLYAVEGWNAASIWRYDFAADAWTLVVDLSKLLPPANNLPDTTWVGTRGMSWDDNRFHITASAGPANYVYDVRLGKLIGPFTLAQAQATAWKPDPAQAAYLFGKSTMDSAGKILYTADNQLVFNIETGAAFVNGFGTPDNQYGDVHADCGKGNVLVSCGGVAKPGPDDGLYPVAMTLDPDKLSSYLAPRRIIGPRFLWGLDSHTSFRDATGQWATFVLDGALMGADLGKVPVFGPEIFQLALASPPDGSLNRRIAHHYSDPSSFTDAGTQYWAGPHASQSQDNRVIGWNSTYGNKRIDVYVAFLDDSALAADLAGVVFTNTQAAFLRAFADSQLAIPRGPKEPL